MAAGSGWEEDMESFIPGGWSNNADIHNVPDVIPEDFPPGDHPHKFVPVDFPPAVDDTGPLDRGIRPAPPAPDSRVEPPRWAPAVGNPGHGSMHRLRAAAAAAYQPPAPPTDYPTSYYDATGEPTYGVSCDGCNDMQLVEEENDESTVVVSY